MTVHHACYNTSCVNPEHLERRTPRDNILDGNNMAAQNDKKTYCKRGHPLSGDNLRRDTDGGRVCKACKRIRKGYQGNRPTGERTHCPRGHEYNKMNTYVRANGWRQCRVCNREARAKRKKKQ